MVPYRTEPRFLHPQEHPTTEGFFERSAEGKCCRGEKVERPQDENEEGKRRKRVSSIKKRRIQIHRQILNGPP